MIDEKTPSWGIEPVPERLRVLGLVDTMLLWGNLSVSLLVIVLGAVLVPALSLPDALIAIVIGAIAGNLLLGLAGLIGADARVPGMVVLRAPLGRRGSYAPTVVNVAQNLGWSTFELIVISTAPQVRRLGGARVDDLPDLVGLRQVEPARVLACARPGRPLARLRNRPRDREHHLVDAARRGLHALLPRPPLRFLRGRDRLLRADALVLWAGNAARALAERHGRSRHPRRGRGRRRGQRLRAARADGCCRGCRSGS